ncbi:MAG: GNAT family N-acetyltransferase [Gammaproteobacteria bacterium]|jgi:ribosomal protein S18 acetylase RimI-like enzyme|nr:GNAT family N-acetyltransferase [Gammaproteobacteria bacterium]
MSEPDVSHRIALRIAKPADVAALHELVNAAYRGDSSRIGWTTEADLLGGQRTDHAALGEFIAAAHGGDRAMLVCPATSDSHAPEEFAACVQLERRATDAYLGMLTVRPGLQSRGLGKALLAGAEDFVAREWRTKTVTMTVIAQREELIAWYLRRGYTRTGETAPFPYGDLRFGEPKRPDLHFVLLQKALG